MKKIAKLSLAIGLLAILVNFLGNESSHAANSPVILAEYQAWFDSASPPATSHIQVYNSKDPVIITKQIQKAKLMGITGFVVDWYGPKAGTLSNDNDRDLIDKATEELIKQAEMQGFKVALLYDEGAVFKDNSGLTESQYMTQLQADLSYAKKYFSSPAYLNINGYPAVFVFPYDEVDSHIGWNTVRNDLGATITLMNKNPKPETFSTHDTFFDGFYAWVQPDDWKSWDVYGKNWGEKYLEWFYSTMEISDPDPTKPNYKNKIKVGGVWPGFDDSIAFWGKHRFISRQNGLVYQKTMALAQQNNAPFILIGTWNDFEEGTDIEFGVDMTINMEDNENFYQDILVRSSPFKVEWNPSRGELALQVYKGGPIPIFDQKRLSGSSVSLASGGDYAVKLWISDSPNDAIIKRVKIRSQDPKHVALPFLMLLRH